MAKSQDLEILDSAVFRQRNDRRFGGSPGQLSSHQQLKPQSVFLTSPEDSSFTFVLSDLPKSNASSTSIQNKTQLQTVYVKHRVESSYTTPEVNQPFYNSDQNSKTLPPKHNPKLHLDFPSSPETRNFTYATVEPRRPNSNKVTGTNFHANLIEFGSPPNSPLKSPTATCQHAYPHSTPGNH